LLVNGSQPGSDVVVSPSTILGGIGTVGAIDSDGTVAPGNSPGRLGSGDTLLQAGSLFDVELNGYMPADCDQLDVNGAVKLDNADLKIAWGFVPAVGDTFTILDNDGADVITGTFNGLPDGSTLTAGNVELKITYAGGTGNDIVLTAADVTELGPLHFISMGMHATNAAMEWAGGVPFYRLEKKESLTNDLWIAVTPLTRDFSGMVPADTTNGFYRVTGGH
jgi:hypothetical protein